MAAGSPPPVTSDAALSNSTYSPHALRRLSCALLPSSGGLRCQRRLRRESSAALPPSNACLRASLALGFLGPDHLRSPPLPTPQKTIYIQYYSPPLRVVSSPEQAPGPELTPSKPPPPPNPAMTFAPANALPQAPPHTCLPNRCNICDGQMLLLLQNATSMNGTLTAPLPHRRTCEPVFCPSDPGIDIHKWSLDASKWLYVALPAYHEAIYDSADKAREQTEGVCNGRHLAAKTMPDAKALWALGCLRWHGHECKRERLQRRDALDLLWAVKGTDIVCGSRAAAFRVAEDYKLETIEIRAHRKESVLRNWLAGESDDDSDDDSDDYSD
ncbi:hypothetical protein DFH06DRAFT_1327899 [Mycena polygramma]|nr:hypothetical protein DFH06DRAFT_1327899 [Mycena polygramma]